MRWAGHVARTGACRVLVGKPEGKRLLWRPRCRWEDNIKIDIQEVGFGDKDWIELAQDMDRWQYFRRDFCGQDSFATIKSNLQSITF
jgi:hypothetical protein